MATGFVTRIKGKIKAHTLYMGGGGIADDKSGIAGKAVLSLRVPLAVKVCAGFCRWPRISTIT